MPRKSILRSPAPVAAASISAGLTKRRHWCVPRGSTRNPERYGAHVRFAGTVTPARRTLLWEAEASGGLLRIGLVHYNTLDEIDRCLRVLDRA